MEKICEFCTSLRPVVYCKSDAAYLCLSCDAKVHSANALSGRHLRTLLCDSCRHRPAYAHCLEHHMFMCHFCDQSMHGVSSQHQKRLVSSYIGCPSAKDFAKLWGFELNVLDKSSLEDQSFSRSSASLQPTVTKSSIPEESCLSITGSSITSKMGCSTLVSAAESDERSSCHQTEISEKDQQHQNGCFILEQILDLKRLQLSEVNSGSAVICGGEQTDLSSSIFHSSKKIDDNLDNLQHSQDPCTNIQQSDSQLLGLKVDSLPLPFSQQEDLPLSSTAANPFVGEPFWQCKSPVQSSQLWYQNMQDLGVCEDIVCHEDFNIPDVDITFRNYEELFGGDQDPIGALLDDKDISCFSVETDMSIVKSDENIATAGEDISAASSACIGQPIQMDKYKGPMNQVYNISRSLDSPHAIRPPYSTRSFSLSRLSAESAGTESVDSGYSPCSTGVETSCPSPKAKENALMRYKEKKKARQQEKQVRYAPRKSKSDVRKRVKGRLAKTAGYGSDTVNETRSY